MSTFHCNKPDCWCRDTRFRATARDEMPQTMEELADELADEDVEETNNMTEVEIDEALLDAGRDPSAIVERALKLIELDTGIVEAPHD